VLKPQVLRNAVAMRTIVPTPRLATS